MKLIDAIRLVERPESTSAWHHSAPIEDCCTALGITHLWDYDDELDRRFKSYPILQWLCTDTHVGLHALYLDGEPVGATMQTARKNDREIEWLSAQHASRVREVLLSYAAIPEYAVIDPDAEIGDDFNVHFVTQALTDDGFYQGRPVRALIWYDGLCGRTTDPQYRREGHAYTESVPYEDPKSNCILVQDGDDQRVIPIEDFRMAFNVKAAAE